MNSGPWYVPSAIKYLEELFSHFDYPLKVFEFGGGSSTIYYLDKGFEVMTIEDSLEYALVILQKVEQLNLNTKMTLLITPRPYFSEYAKAIKSEKKFDLVVIDGWDRPQCLTEIYNLRESLPTILVLDNSERNKYQKEFQPFYHFYDFRTFSHANGWSTSIGLRRNENESR